MRWPALPLLALPLFCAAQMALNERLSGYAEMRAETRAMQDDDSANPGMLWVLEGENLWNARPGGDAKPCSACHSRR